MLALSVAGCSRDADLADPLAGIENVTIDHYDVAGTTPAEIRAAMDRNGPLDPHDGTRNNAIVSWRIEWRYGDDAGGCDLATTRTIFFQARVLMPQLVSPDVPPHVRAEWDRYSAALLAHEAGHVRNAFRRRADV